MKSAVRYIFFILLLLPVFVCAQTKDSTVNDSARVIRPQDSLRINVKAATIVPDSTKNKHIPRKATIRSAIIPGWGQAYNKKYWKIPIVYAAIGIPVGTFIYNRKWYNRTRDAAKMLGSNPIDTANYRNRVHPNLYIFFDKSGTLPSLLNYRNEFRRSMDYSVVFALIAWGLNVVDATVDGHLKDFDVSDDLSLRIKPTILSGTTTAGVSFVFTIGRNPSKTITSLR
ncbi:MAG: hypothetical protein H7Y31_14275 [Chitinophagaceae bacterium]|nr:hypothetical protein [Chitinophagaceae bacterium]